MKKTFFAVLAILFVSCTIMQAQGRPDGRPPKGPDPEKRLQDMKERLNLSEKQYDQIKVIFDDMEKERRGMREERSGDRREMSREERRGSREEMMKKMMAQRDEADKKIMEILNEDQIVEFKKMIKEREEMMIKGRDIRKERPKRIE